MAKKEEEKIIRDITYKRRVPYWWIEAKLIASGILLFRIIVVLISHLGTLSAATISKITADEEVSTT